MTYSEFKKEIWRYHKTNRRDLPWRNTRDPYRILVSEIMLQQTQVSRVIPYYQKFIKEFPNFQTLASTPINQLLSAWQGLGYNRRALNLKKLSQILVRNYRGELPDDPTILKTLPGVGKGTTGALAAFAFNKPVPFIETNIRRVFIHFFFHSKKNVEDQKILQRIEKTLPKKNAREWYYALMDYGAMLGKTAENANRKSKSYKIQPRFKGSNRELRGKILRLLIEKKHISQDEIVKRLAEPPARIQSITEELCKEGFSQRLKGDIIQLCR